MLTHVSNFKTYIFSIIVLTHLITVLIFPYFDCFMFTVEDGTASIIMKTEF